MIRFKIILTVLFLFLHLPALSENHNKIEVELERVKKDIIDLQKFVYQNDNLELSDQNTDFLNLENINKSIFSLEERLISLEDQMNDMKKDIKNLYQLYTSPQISSDVKLNPTKELNIEESSSSIISEKNNDDQTLGQMGISDLEANLNGDQQIEKQLEILDDDKNDQVLGELSISNLEEQKIVSLELNLDQENTLDDLEQLLEQREIELNKPIINVLEQMKIAKQSLASLDNQKAIESLLLIVSSDTQDFETLAETYYLLGRTFFIEGKIIESVKYFGIRHRDLSNIEKFRTDNYFWLGRSLFGIGDQDNGCLIMEDLIFSNSYLDKPDTIEEAKKLQEEKDCGLIID